MAIFKYGDVCIPKHNRNQSNFYRLSNLEELEFIDTCGYQNLYGEFLIRKGYSRNNKYDSNAPAGTQIILSLDAVELKHKVNSESNYSIF